MPEFISAPYQKSLAILKLALTRLPGTVVGSETLDGVRHIPAGPLIHRFTDGSKQPIYIEVWPDETEESVRANYRDLP